MLDGILGTLRAPTELYPWDVSCLFRCLIPWRSKGGYRRDSAVHLADIKPEGGASQLSVVPGHPWFLHDEPAIRGCDWYILDLFIPKEGVVSKYISFVFLI